MFQKGQVHMKTQNNSLDQYKMQHKQKQKCTLNTQHFYPTEVIQFPNISKYLARIKANENVRTRVTMVLIELDSVQVQKVYIHCKLHNCLYKFHLIGIPHPHTHLDFIILCVTQPEQRPKSNSCAPRGEKKQYHRVPCTGFPDLHTKKQQSRNVKHTLCGGHRDA